ncbi:hypothetical protein [Sphingobium sp. Ant17]|uniref:hypothetical protein n=1 Tax=Sphingobium sp. Ant17 TaxID=1461752 RepID=UPI000451A320|nr:hypothetical protein [Sphingobium sp. Ant17]EXS69798.1 hypothetical protein BF95_22025 [Sphingobium sp. Ant17]
MTSQPAPPTAITASPATLAKATGAAAIGAVAILTLFVLPAEYGIDPTGVGGALGLTGMVAEPSGPAPATAQPATPATAPTLPTRDSIARTTPWRQDSMTITLAPHSGQEVKAHMQQGDSFVFEWQSTGGPVKVDMHGEAPDATDGAFTSYWEEREQTNARGSFTAPFAGTHGWYWRNKGDTPVTVTVKTTGFYKDMFQPAGG